MTCSAPCEFTKATSQRLCSSSKRASTLLKLALFLQLLQILLELLDFLRRLFLVAFKVSALREIELGSSSVTFSSRSRLSTLSKKPRYSFSTVMNWQVRAFQFRGAFAVAHDQAFGRTLHHDLDEFAIVLDVLLRLALLDRIQRRLRNVHVAALDQFLHVAEEERQQQRADVRAVHVGVGHQDDLAVAQLRRIEVIFRKCRCRAP